MLFRNQLIMHNRPTRPLNTLITSPALLHITSITNTEIRPRTNTILATIRTMRHTSTTIRTCRIRYIALPTSTLIRPCALPIQTRIATASLANASRLVQCPACFTGTLVWRGTNAVFAALRAAGDASLVLKGVAFLAGALVWADAGASRAAAFTEVFAFLWAWVFYESVDRKKRCWINQCVWFKVSRYVGTITFARTELVTLTWIVLQTQTALRSF